jgi:hypothetical protein
MLRFHCVVLSEQSCDSSTGQGEKASAERPVAAGHLQDTISPLRFNKEKQQTFHFVDLV